MRYFRLFWDVLYAITLGCVAAAGFSVTNLSIKKKAEYCKNEEKES